jgi:Flp pilus assembly protein TadG
MGKIHMIRRFASKLALFRRDQRGNVAVIVGAAIIPLIGALGLATDTARGYLVKARLSQALDAAALAGGKVYFSTQRDADIKKFFGANFPSASTPIYDAPYNATFMNAKVTLSHPVNGGTPGKENLTLKATATIPTTFMRVLGFDTVTVDASTQVTRAISALDVVLSMDMSGSMDGTKILSARSSALNFIDTVFSGQATAPQLTIDGVTYNLLNMGFVPWNAKTRVTTQGQTFSSVTTQAVTPFTNPVTGDTQSVLYYANNSEVPLLINPNNLAGGWSGCVYARYLGDAYNNNDADTVRGQVTMGSGAGQKQWMGWEPMSVDDSEPRGGNWYDKTNSSGSGNAVANGPSGTRWVDTTSAGATWRTKRCNNAYFLDIGTTNYDNADGSIKSSPSPYSAPPTAAAKTGRPAAVPNPKAATGSNYTEWTSGTTSVTKKYSGFMKFIDPTKSYLEPGSTATYYSNPGSADCSKCLTRGIIPLTSTKATIYNQVSSITSSDPDGNTDLEQGLYWAWEVLAPGVPFNQAVPTVPFKRIRAIVIMTDGAQVGGAGDAYKGRFGYQEGAAYNDDPDHGTIQVKQSTVVGTSYNTPESAALVSVPNNLNNRAKQLADNIKFGGDKIKIYTIGVEIEGDAVALRLLDEIASDPDENGEYFFHVTQASELDSVFKQIAASLSNLRVSQ